MIWDISNNVVSKNIYSIYTTKIQTLYSNNLLSLKDLYKIYKKISLSKNTKTTENTVDTKKTIDSDSDSNILNDFLISSITDIYDKVKDVIVDRWNDEFYQDIKCFMDSINIKHDMDTKRELVISIDGIESISPSSSQFSNVPTSQSKLTDTKTSENRQRLKDNIILTVDVDEKDVVPHWKVVDEKKEREVVVVSNNDTSPIDNVTIIVSENNIIFPPTIIVDVEDVPSLSVSESLSVEDVPVLIPESLFVEDVPVLIPENNDVENVVLLESTDMQPITDIKTIEEDTAKTTEKDIVKTTEKNIAKTIEEDIVKTTEEDIKSEEVSVVALNDEETNSPTFLKYKIIEDVIRFTLPSYQKIIENDTYKKSNINDIYLPIDDEYGGCKCFLCLKEIYNNTNIFRIRKTDDDGEYFNIGYRDYSDNELYKVVYLKSRYLYLCKECKEKYELERFNKIQCVVNDKLVASIDCILFKMKFNYDVFRKRCYKVVYCPEFTNSLE
jgi:hypothetical protein